MTNEDELLQALCGTAQKNPPIRSERYKNQKTSCREARRLSALQLCRKKTGQRRERELRLKRVLATDYKQRTPKKIDTSSYVLFDEAFGLTKRKEYFSICFFVHLCL